MDGQRELLLAKLRDAARTGGRRPCFLGFLDESEAAFCRDFLRKEPMGHLLWGGYDGAERVMAGFFPDYMELGGGFPYCRADLRLPAGG